MRKKLKEYIPEEDNGKTIRQLIDEGKFDPDFLRAWTDSVVDEYYSRDDS